MTNKHKNIDKIHHTAFKKIKYKTVCSKVFFKYGTAYVLFWEFFDLVTHDILLKFNPYLLFCRSYITMKCYNSSVKIWHAVSILSTSILNQTKLKVIKHINLQWTIKIIIKYLSKYELFKTHM